MAIREATKTPLKAAELPVYYNAADILEHNLEQRADKKALFSRERNLTFREVSDEANRIGNALRGLGVGFGDVVGLLCFDQPEWVTTFFGTLKVGAVHLGMNTLLTPREFEQILQDSRAKVLVGHEKLLDPIEEIRENLDFLEHVVVIGEPRRDGDHVFDAWIADESAELETEKTHREDIATLNYSSGTTGAPKGIPHAHKDLPLTAHNWGLNVLGLGEEDRTFAVAKLFFTFGTGGNLIFPWYVGASSVLYAGSPRQAVNVLEVIDEFNPTVFYTSPTGYASMLAVEGMTEKYDLSSLRQCVSAGEALPAPIWQRWKEATGVDTVDGIGSTEVWHIFISNRPDDIRPGSSGKPVPGYEVKIVDEKFNEVEPGEIGNLLVKGESVALAYLHQYYRSKQTFRGEWLFTGDKYRRDEDGYYWHAGRSDDMMKVGGIWVSPVEVESTLISHDKVLECAVVEERDQDDLVKPKAYVVLNEGVKPGDELAGELIEYCRENMAGYKRPRWIEFVEELPKTATGKVQRFKLREETG